MPRDMQRTTLVMKIEDADHMTEQWFFVDGTKEMTETFKVALQAVSVRSSG